MILRFYINNQTLHLLSRSPVVADSDGYLDANFQFSSDWEGYSKTAQFKRTVSELIADGGDPLFYNVAIDSNGDCKVPWEVLKGKGTFNVNVFGQKTNTDGTTATTVTANSVDVQVGESGLTDGQLPATSTGTLYDGFSAKVLEAGEAAKTAQTAAETAATNAQTSETNAQASAKAASASAEAASNSASAASNSASAAATSATTASDAAKAAADSESKVANSADSAAKSASAASASQSAAATSEKAAADSATAAASSDSSAKDSAALSKTWAVSTESPDGETDTESSTNKSQSSRSWAIASRGYAVDARRSRDNLDHYLSDVKVYHDDTETIHAHISDVYNLIKESQSITENAAAEAVASRDRVNEGIELSKAWAVSTESPDGETDTESETGKTQSSRSWSFYSKARAAAALTSENNAKTSETNAKASEQAAATSMKNAQTSEAAADVSAKAAASSQTAAASSESNAAASEKNAKTSETNAKTSETNAADSAKAALASQTAAASSESNASDYKDSASKSETNAANSASAASASQSAAATSESNAAKSASAASASQTAAATSETNAAASEAAAKQALELANKANDSANAALNKITGAVKYMGSVDNYADLPTTGNANGDMWNVANADTEHGIKAGDNVVWSETKQTWDDVSGIVDLSNYYTKDDVASAFTSATASGDTITFTSKGGTTSTATISSVASATAAVKDGKGNVIADTYETAADANNKHSSMQTAIEGLTSSKQDKLTFDTTPIADSTNPVTSGGVKAAIPTKLSDLTGYATVATSGKYSDLTGTPESLKNPNALTFTGGATGSYDGSSAVSVAIPTYSAAGTELTLTGTAFSVNASEVNKQITSANVTNALGFTPMNSTTKLSGITDDVGYAKSADVAETYESKADLATSVTTVALTVTGTTSVPTASEGDSSQTIATTAFVGTAVQNTANQSVVYTNRLQRSKEYAVGDIAYSPNYPSYVYLECVTAGTTADTEPDFSTATTKTSDDATTTEDASTDTSSSSDVTTEN